MADLSAITVFGVVLCNDKRSAPVNEAVTAGAYVRYNTSTGKYELGNTSSAAEARDGGIALHDAAASEGLTVAHSGLFDCGNIFSSLNYDASIYLGSTDGILASGSSANCVNPIGRVEPLWGATTADKGFRLFSERRNNK